MKNINYNVVETVIIQLAALDIDYLNVDQQAKLYRIAAAEVGASPRATLDVIRAFIASAPGKKETLKRAAMGAITGRALYNATKMYRTTVR